MLRTALLAKASSLETTFCYQTKLQVFGEDECQTAKVRLFSESPIEINPWEYALFMTALKSFCTSSEIVPGSLAAYVVCCSNWDICT